MLLYCTYRVHSWYIEGVAGLVTAGGDDVGR